MTPKKTEWKKKKTEGKNTSRYKIERWQRAWHGFKSRDRSSNSKNWRGIVIALAIIDIKFQKKKN